MKEIKKMNIEVVSFSDLYSMYGFVNAMNINNLNPAMKSMVKNKTTELENEIFIRLFNFNPFLNNDSQAIEIKGADPIKILQSIDTDEKTFIVMNPGASNK